MVDSETVTRRCMTEPSKWKISCLMLDWTGVPLWPASFRSCVQYHVTVSLASEEEHLSLIWLPTGLQSRLEGGCLEKPNPLGQSAKESNSMMYVYNQIRKNQFYWLLWYRAENHTIACAYNVPRLPAFVSADIIKYIRTWLKKMVQSILPIGACKYMKFSEYLWKCCSSVFFQGQKWLLAFYIVPDLLAICLWVGGRSRWNWHNWTSLMTLCFSIHPFEIKIVGKTQMEVNCSHLCRRQPC